MVLEILIVVFGLALGEFIAWQHEILWHRDEDKADRRNWPPPR